MFCVEGGTREYSIVYKGEGQGAVMVLKPKERRKNGREQAPTSECVPIGHLPTRDGVHVKETAGGKKLHQISAEQATTSHRLPYREKYFYCTASPYSYGPTVLHVRASSTSSPTARTVYHNTPLAGGSMQVNRLLRPCSHITRAMRFDPLMAENLWYASTERAIGCAVP